MNYLLDIIVATFFGGFILLMIIKLSTDISASSYEMQSHQISQENAIETVKTLEFDLYKVGYKVTGEKIKIADSTTIKYFADIDNNDVIDSIKYYIGNESDLPNTTNPNDKPFYRKRNNNQAEMIGTVTTFNFAYFDSTGALLSYSDLANASEREKIRSIRALIGFEANEPYESVYQGVDFLRRISPKNLDI